LDIVYSKSLYHRIEEIVGIKHEKPLDLNMKIIVYLGH